MISSSPTIRNHIQLCSPHYRQTFLALLWQLCLAYPGRPLSSVRKYLQVSLAKAPIRLGSYLHHLRLLKINQIFISGWTTKQKPQNKDPVYNRLFSGNERYQWRKLEQLTLKLEYSTALGKIAPGLTHKIRTLFIVWNSYLDEYHVDQQLAVELAEPRLNMYPRLSDALLPSLTWSCPIY